MNQLSLETLKALIEINGDINSDYQHKDALFFRILKAAMRLVCCEMVCYITVENGVILKLVSKIKKDKETVANIDIVKSGIFDIVLRGESLYANDANEDLYYSQFLTQFDDDIDSFLFVPVKKSDSVYGIICLFNKVNSDFNENDKFVIESLASLAAGSLENFNKIQSQLNQISMVAGKLNSSNNVKIHDFVVKSPVIQDLMVYVKKAAVTNSSVLITGESGVGKELFAEQIYLNSNRVNKPFVRVNCAALSETLMESELFGHEKGAYTSAESSKKGRFEIADGGTIFLDEVGEIPLHLQPKLLRIIQDKQFERVGSAESISVDVRIIAATNRNLEEMVQNGLFREDLFFRLNVLPIRIPPLRARPDDIIPIAESFLKKYSNEYGKRFTGFSESAAEALQGYLWPGNVRELDNAVARACILGTEPIIMKDDFRLSITDSCVKQENDEGNTELASVIFNSEDKTLKNALNIFKRTYLLKILEECKWNQTKAGKVLGIQRTYVSRLMNELHIREK
ncbi:MAG: sigma 54-interacting transcriptional regulator [Treponema sp.]|nr:sigma 54-interacting transcriptional regulator [Treponema sp.]